MDITMSPSKMCRGVKLEYSGERKLLFHEKY